MADFRALCADLAARLEWFIDEDDTNEGDPSNAYWIKGKRRAVTVLTRARAALAQPEPVGATDEEIDALLPLGMASYSTLCGPREIRAFARAVLQRSQ
jgi:hypothetical protein